MLDDRFSVLAKPTGAVCNLECEYCFFLSKDQVLDGADAMDEATMELHLRRYLDEQPDGKVTVAWQGGEPTMRGRGFFAKAFDLAERLARPRQHVNHVLQTNGTFLDDEWAALLADHQVLVGVSMDGPASMHDAYRVNRAGRGSHAQVLRGWRALERHDVPRNILCTVHRANQDHPLEVYRYFRDELGARHIQFIPIVERVHASQLAVAENGWRKADGTRLLYVQEGHHVTSRSVDPAAWGAFLTAVFDEWVTRDVGSCFVQLFDVMLGNLFGMYSLCVHSPECGNALVLAHNGDVYSCDHFVEPRHRLGSIRESSYRELVNTSRHREFGALKSALPSDCRRCPVRWACQGGCPKDRIAPDADGGRHLNYLCPGYRAFFTHAAGAMMAMAELVANGEPASRIMDEPPADEPTSWDAGGGMLGTDDYPEDYRHLRGVDTWRTTD